MKIECRHWVCRRCWCRQRIKCRQILTCVGNETGTDELSNECAEVRGDGSHAVLQVVEQLLTVLRKRNNLVAELSDVVDILNTDLQRVRIFSPFFLRIFHEVFEKILGNFCENSVHTSVPMEIWATSLTCSAISSGKKSVKSTSVALVLTPIFLTVLAKRTWSGMTRESSGKCQPYHSLVLMA